MEIQIFLEKIIPYIAGALEAIGVFVIVVASIQAFIKFIEHRFDIYDEDIKIHLSIAMSLALDFKLGAEILQTVTVRNLDEFFMLAAVTVLRIMMSVVIHWEVKSKERKEGMKRVASEEAINKEKSE